MIHPRLEKQSDNFDAAMLSDDGDEAMLYTLM
jgi:hypothetical protein